MTVTGNQIDEETIVPTRSQKSMRASRQWKRNTGVIVGAAVLAAAVGLGGGYLLFRDDGGTKVANPDAASAALAAGLQAEIQGDTATAIQKFHTVVVLDPKNKLAYYNLGLIEQNSKDLTQAEADYRTAITLDPKYAPALYNLGIIRANVGASVEAIDLYRRATVADPSFARAYLNLGLLLFDAGDKPGSATALSKAVQLDPTLLARIPEAARPAA